MALTDRPSRISRRTALRLGLGATLGAAALPLLAACQPAAAPAPTAAPSKPADTAAKPTDAPAAKPADASKPTEAAQAAPAAKTSVSEVLIGALFPTSGSLIRPGETIMNAVNLAVEDINAAGGVKALGGAKVRVIAADTRSDPQVARSEAERLITSNKLTSVLGAYASAHSLVASEVTERAEIPFMTASITNPLVERGFKYIFQVSPRASQFGEAQLKLAGEAAGESKKAAVVFENTAYGTSTSKGIQDGAGAAGLEVVLFEPYEANFTDAGPLVNKIKSSGATVLFPVSYPNDTALIIKTMKQQSVKLPIVGGGAGFVLPDFGKQFGADSEGVLSAEAWNWDISEDSKAIDTRYRAKYNEFLQEYAGEAYNQMWILVVAMEAAGSNDPKTVRDAITKLDLTKGPGSIMPGGHVQFDEKGWNKFAFAVGAQWQKGEFLTVYPKEVAKATLQKPQ